MSEKLGLRKKSKKLTVLTEGTNCMYEASNSGLNVTNASGSTSILADKPNEAQTNQAQNWRVVLKSTPTSTAAMWKLTAALMPTPPCYPIIILWENKLPQLQKGLNVTNRLRLSQILKEFAPLCIPFSRTQMEPYFFMRVVEGWRDRSSWSSACMAHMIPRIHIKNLGVGSWGSRDRWLSFLVSHPDLYSHPRFTERSCV